ncbi:PglZ domain-containing protein [Leptospira bandrabouensis]|uniref:PglZ domain-containing protein n=1 Tax=Leptospira bandrabouensis TaxID=2484903 RepID=UPI001EE7C4DC|nr:PglZ domain-containing protein [Leptospira bandrabouensis]MCG6146515.1 PglZ domain-containing protein [Leptospira bandrabouensis]MCG6161887.1 PglZ domain-containing protein [Leptospira bandrabouensis]MCG6166062.1 PglZ domain-containing protein [Leptospira bandrabouensis]
MSLLYNAITSYIDLKINRECLVSWIDPTGEFSGYIDQLEEEILQNKKKYHLVRFKGSFLESILALHKLMQDVKKPDCLVYIPFISQDEIEKTPFLEVLKSSEQVPSDSKILLEKISSGYLSPDQLRKCIEGLPANFEKLEAILSGEDVDLSMFDSPKSVIEFTKALLSGKNTILDNIEKHPKGTLLQLQRGFEKTFGYIPKLTEDIIDHRTLQSAKEKEDHSIYRLPLGVFLLGREYVNDLQNYRPISQRLIQLQEQGLVYLDTIKEVLNSLRDESPEAYKSLALEIEEQGFFDTEKDNVKSKDLGYIDTFYFEDSIHQIEVLRLIQIKYYNEANALAKGRQNSFWKKNDPNVSQFWHWVDVTLNIALSIHETSKKFQNAKTLEHVLVEYSSELYKIDREYRYFCKSTEILMHSTNQKYLEISLIRKQIWDEYSDWINNTNNHYQSICEKNGFLPAHSQHLQRFYFQNHLKPLLDLGKTAVFFVDAMRYEIGELLKAKLEEFSLKPTIEPIFAELPTITSVGMNVIVPTEMNGELEPIIDKDEKSINGFRTGNRNVITKEDRRLILREISKRQVEWVDLEDFHRNFKQNEAKAKSADLYVVHSLEIDLLGENGFLNQGFDFFEETISKIKISIDRLREIGFENFSIISDHGFIQYDTASEQARSTASIPSNFKGARRYVLQEDRISSSDYSRIEMPSLRYKGSSLELVFLREPKIFKNAPSNKGFFHGGNSMQERIIPVITLKSERKKEEIPNDISYEILAELFIGKGKHRIELSLNTKNENVLFKTNQELIVELDSVDGARLKIISSNAISYDNNGIVVEPNTKVNLEFEIITTDKLYQEKASVKIWSPTLNSKIKHWTSFVKVPLSSEVQLTESSIDAKYSKSDLNLPPDVESDVSIILNALLKQPNKLLTEVGIGRIYGDSRRSARAVRILSNFLQNRSNELDFTVSIDHGAEGKIFKIGKKSYE